jgi:N-acyl-D-aspartate/D-glutamate deacylase
MGERGAKNEPATPEDIAAMAEIVREGIEAGALGFSTSRTIAHMAIDGEPVPGTFAAEDELFGIGKALGELGRGVFELAPAGALGEDLAAPDREMAWMRKLSAAIGRPVTFAMTQNDHDPDAWRRMLELSAEAVAEGARVRPQVAGRPVTLLLGLQTFHVFSYCPTYGLLGMLPLAERVARLRDPEVREKLLAEVRAGDSAVTQFVDPERVFPLGANPNYEPAREDSIAARAHREGRDVYDVYYDALLEDDGYQLLLRPLLNYTHFNLDALREMLLHPSSAWGLGDGGAHCGTTCDASTPTFMLTHWARDRDHDRLPIEWVVKKMTRDSASLYGLDDRGVLAPGMLGDVNVVDLDNLRLERPVMVRDLPGDARRFVQGSEGYVATVKRGRVVLRAGEDQGERPGELLRGVR